MLLCAQYVIPVTSEPLRDCAILVRDNIIGDIGPAEILKLRYPDEEVRDYGDAALLPGFVDTHTHIENTVLRGIIDDVPYVQWMFDVTAKCSHLDFNDFYESSIIGGLEAISSGITCIADVSASGAACTAFRELGLRGIFYRQVSAMEKSRIDFAMESAKNDVFQWQDQNGSDLIQVGIAPNTLYTCHPALYSRVADFATKENLPVSLHLAGSREEYLFIKRGSSPFAVAGQNMRHGFVELPPWLPTNTSPIRYVLNWGALECPNVIAVHCIHLDEDDLSKLKAYNTAIAVCPCCNAQLGMGISPISEFLRAGLRVGIGTDTPAATDSTDVLKELHMGMLLQRASSSRSFLNAETMLKLGTIDAARALNLDDRIGSLEQNKCADIIAIDLSGSRVVREVDPIAAIVNTRNGSDVLMTMVNGKILYDQNGLDVDIDIAKNIASIIKIREKISKTI